jgi:glutamine amidotransferase
MLLIVDYGRGNLRSVQKGFAHVGITEPEISADPARLPEADGLILPGVGAFRDAMERLEAGGLDIALHAAVAQGVPLLGICLGMQLLLDRSCEFGEYPGLGMISGQCQRFDEKAQGVKVPHIGWNTVDFAAADPLTAGIASGSSFYFVHSYYCVPKCATVVRGQTEYGLSFASILRQDNIWATQFHPEKSSGTGLRLLKNFAQICEEW